MLRVMIIVLSLLLFSFPLWSAPQDTEETTDTATKKPKRKYFIPDPGRVDAGIFHVGFALGGNFYIEPILTVAANGNRTANGDYYRDLGFGGGVYLDWDYGDIPLGLRTSFNYKYILRSVHTFSIDAVARHMFSFSDKARFGVGVGTSAAIWYRTLTPQTTYEEVYFLPALVVESGFEFNPFMVEVKWLINQWGIDRTVMGFELYFGVHL